MPKKKNTENASDNKKEVMDKEVPIEENKEEKDTADESNADKEKEYLDKLLRLTAEFDNFRKRTQKEKEMLYNDGRADCVTEFLPLLDNIERSVTAESNYDSLLKGIELILKQFKDILSKMDVEEIPAMGEQFDPEIHNAVMHIEDETTDTNTIIEEFQKGYKMKGKVIRHSMVKVAN